MKSLSKLKLNDAHKLSSNEMKRLEGGISQSEYCSQISSNFTDNASHWSTGAIEGWWYGWSTYCK
jgi:natural product precursor